MSTPHFLDGDPELAAAIDGIQPVHDKHVTYLHVEPLSGTTLHGMLHDMQHAAQDDMTRHVT